LPLLQRRLEPGQPCAVVVAVAVVAVCSFFAAATVCCPSRVGCERECKRDGRFRQVLRSVPGVLNLVLVLQLSDPALVPDPALNTPARRFVGLVSAVQRRQLLMLPRRMLLLMPRRRPRTKKMKKTGRQFDARLLQMLAIP